MRKHKKDFSSSPPKVSVIMPTYNGAAFIRKSINSVLKQSFKDFELIIINDGSTDNTESIIRRYRDKRIVHLENKVNEGTSAARNKGIRHARGAYIAFCDHDDIFYPNHLKVLSDYLDSHLRTGLVYADSYVLFQKRRNKRKLILHSVDFEKHLLEICNFINPSEVMCRAKCFQKAGLFDTHPIIKKHSSEDWDMWLRISDHFFCIHIKKILSAIIWHKNNRSNNVEFTISFNYVIHNRIKQLSSFSKRKNYVDTYGTYIIYKLLEFELYNLAKKMVLLFRKYSDRPHISACLGLQNFSQGKFKSASKYFNESLEKFDRRKAIYGDLHRYSLCLIYLTAANTYSALGNYLKAESLYKKAIQLALKNTGEQHHAPSILKTTVRDFWVSHYIRFKRLGIAKEISRKCHKSTQQYVMGMSYFAEGSYQKAVNEFRKCIANNTFQCTTNNSIEKLLALKKDAMSFAMIYYNLGVTYLKLGKLETAKRIFHKTLKFNPTFLMAKVTTKHIF